MPKRHADPFEISIGQVRQHRQVDVILGKPLCVLPETELLQPVGDLLHRGSAPDYRASFTRVDKTTRQILNAVGSRVRPGGLRGSLPEFCMTAAQPPCAGLPCARAGGRHPKVLYFETRQRPPQPQQAPRTSALGMPTSMLRSGLYEKQVSPTAVQDLQTIGVSEDRRLRA